MDGTKFLEYHEDLQSKSNQGGLVTRKWQPKVIKVLGNSDPSRNIVLLYDKYVSLLLPDPKCNALYKYELPPGKVTAHTWYQDRPLSINAIAKVVNMLMTRAGIPGYFTNHSLHMTVVTRMFNAGIEEQVVKEHTGHKSDAIRAYKRTSDSVLEQAERAANWGEVQSTKEGQQGWRGRSWFHVRERIVWYVSQGWRKNCQERTFRGQIPRRTVDWLKLLTCYILVSNWCLLLMLCLTILTCWIHSGNSTQGILVDHTIKSATEKSQHAQDKRNAKVTASAVVDEVVFKPTCLRLVAILHFVREVSFVSKALRVFPLPVRFLVVAEFNWLQRLAKKDSNQTKCSHTPQFVEEKHRRDNNTCATKIEQKTFCYIWVCGSRGQGHGLDCSCAHAAISSEKCSEPKGSAPGPWDASTTKPNLFMHRNFFFIPDMKGRPLNPLELWICVWTPGARAAEAPLAVSLGRLFFFVDHSHLHEHPVGNMDTLPSSVSTVLTSCTIRLDRQWLLSQIYDQTIRCIHTWRAPVLCVYLG